MSLPHALLVALIEQPCSGLALAERFQYSIGNYWHATHQQIYRELSRLAAAEWVKVKPIESARGGKKEYRVMAAGRKELRRWIAQACDIGPYRSDLMIRLRAHAVLGSRGLASAIEQRLARHRARLEIYRDIEERTLSEANADRSAAILHLILKKGVMNESTWVAWLTEALCVLGQGAVATQRAKARHQAPRQAMPDSHNSNVDPVNKNRTAALIEARA